MSFLWNVIAIMRVKWQMMHARVELSPEEEDLRFCYHTLEKVSRSFAVAIVQLKDEELRNCICLFYLVLRALDTVEDDMSIPVEVKLRELPKFYTHLEDLDWCMQGVGAGDERVLLEQFYRVSRECAKLRKEYQSVISDICAQMAMGMCTFLQRPVVTVEDYDLYCHYVAGLVGHGLTRIFANCRFEDPHLADDLSVSNHMGLFLQKVNITRDYFEDIREVPPRVFWPKEIWGQYAADISDFTNVANEAKAVECLNAMVANAMTHTPYVIQYIASLREPSVFRFCAVPQVMALATLLEVYNNPNTFQIKVKMGKAATCRVMTDCSDLYHTLTIFREYCEVFLRKLSPTDPSTPRLQKSLHNAICLAEGHLKASAPVSFVRGLLNHYPALGGRLLITIADNVASFFSSSSTITSQ